MSASSKPRGDNRMQGKPSAAQPAAPQPPPKKAPSPPLPATASRSRPAMPDANIGPAPPHETGLRAERGLDSGWPSMPPPGTDDDVQVSIAGTFERLLSLEDLDLDLDPVDPKGASGGMTPADLAEVRGLFAQLAANHVRQVRDFMIDLRWSEATVDWIGICEPALRSLRRAADKLDLGDLCQALDRFCGALASSRAAGARTLEGEQRNELLARYNELSALMPQAFALDLDANQREAVIVQSLLLQVPDVKKATIDRLYSAGLTTLQAFFLGNAGDIALAAGIPGPLAARIVEHFRGYREKVRGSVPDATRALEREQLAQLVACLRAEHDEYERAAESWTREAGEKKRALRGARARTLLEIQLVLARLGEVEQLGDVERLPYERKLQRLEAFLVEARDKYEQQ